MLNRIISSKGLAGAIALCTILSTGCQASSADRSEAPAATSTATALQRSNATTEPAAVKASKVADTSTATSPTPKSPAPNTPAPIAPVPISAVSSNGKGFDGDRVGPQIGTLTKLEAADSCHVIVTGQDGQTYSPGAEFRFCIDYRQYLNKEVKITYEKAIVSTCLDGSDQCPGAITYGPTREATLITHVEPVGASQATNTPTSKPNAGSKTTTYYEGRNWQVMVAAFEPWSGEQNAGNFTLKAMELAFNDGVDVADTIDLGNGKITCNSMACSTVWQDGNVRYALIEDISLEDRFSNGPTDTAGFMIFVGDRQVNQTVELQQERPNP